MRTAGAPSPSSTLPRSRRDAAAARDAAHRPGAGGPGGTARAAAARRTGDRRSGDVRQPDPRPGARDSSRRDLRSADPPAGRAASPTHSLVYISCIPRTRGFCSKAFDVAVPMGSLGRLYRNRPTDFPGTPYLRPGAAAREQWAERLGPRAASGLRIGLTWRGGTAAHRHGGAGRSPWLRLAPVLALPDCEFVSLQYGDPGAEVAAINAGLANPVRLFPPAEIEDFEPLAALIGTLDVVVSVQTRGGAPSRARWGRTAWRSCRPSLSGAIRRGGARAAQA